MRDAFSLAGLARWLKGYGPRESITCSARSRMRVLVSWDSVLSISKACTASITKRSRMMPLLDRCGLSAGQRGVELFSGIRRGEGERGVYG